MVSVSPVIPRGGLRSFLEPYARTQQQLDGMTRFLSYLCSTPEAREANGGEFVVLLRSRPQMARGMGLPAGPTLRATANRWNTQVKRWIRYLEPVGVRYETAPRRPGRGDRGILVRIPAGVAQSVRATPGALRRRALRIVVPSFWGEVCRPPSGRTSLSVVREVSSHPRAIQARVRERSAHTTGPPSQPGARAALIRKNPASSGRVEAAVAVWRENTGRPWKLSAHTADQLERYCALLDRDVGPGYGIRWLTAQIEDAFEPHVGTAPVLQRKPWDRDAPEDYETRPRSLAFFVKLLRQKYRRVRKERRARG